MPAWESVKNFVFKYWQLLIGVLMTIILLLRHGLASKDQQEVLKNEIAANKKIAEINRTFDAKIRLAEKAANIAHNAKDAEIKRVRY